MISFGVPLRGCTCRGPCAQRWLKYTVSVILGCFRESLALFQNHPFLIDKELFLAHPTALWGFNPSLLLEGFTHDVVFSITYQHSSRLLWRVSTFVLHLPAYFHSPICNISHHLSYLVNVIRSVRVKQSLDMIVMAVQKKAAFHEVTLLAVARGCS